MTNQRIDANIDKNVKISLNSIFNKNNILFAIFANNIDAYT